MKPKSLSASALQVYEACPARYKAEHIDKARGPAGRAASLGTSVHGALELYVQEMMKSPTQTPPDLKYLLDMFKISYMTSYSSDTDTEDYRDGVSMLKDWYERTDWTGVTVLSCEVKETFPIPTSIGDVPYNYIWDRHDQISETEFKIVDYKTNRWSINPQDLKKKIQARCYGLAAQIKHPQASRIWVEFDMLRHGGPVGIVFTREENAATWRWIKAKAEEIINTPDDEVEESLNPECLFCVRKQECQALLLNIGVGGIFSIAGSDEAVDRRAMLEYQKRAVESSIKELDAIILSEAKELDVIDFESDLNKLFITASSRRTADAEMVEKVIGEDLFERYGGKSITMTAVDKLLKSSDLDASQKAQLKGLIYTKRGEPSVKVEPKNPIDSD